MLRARTLPPGLADFYRSWNGVRLFADTIIVVPLDAVAALPASTGVRLGEWPEGALELGSDGRVRSRGEDGAAIVVGSSLERFLAVAMAREGFLVERDGEFKDVFEEEGVDERVRDKQTKAALKINPDAAAWHLESAERAFAEGEDGEAEAALARAVALDEDAAEAWGLLGALQRRSGRLGAAAASWARAAASTAPGGERAERAAEAARAAAEAGDEAARAAHAAAAQAADAGAVARSMKRRRGSTKATATAQSTARRWQRRWRPTRRRRSSKKRACAASCAQFVARDRESRRALALCHACAAPARRQTCVARALRRGTAVALRLPREEPCHEESCSHY